MMNNQQIQNPLISVIIPVFNGERFIAHAIQSVLDQKYEPLEIIVVDDGSEDNTANILKSFGNKIHYFHQKNGGIANARNNALMHAKGAFIAFVDADDLFVPDKLNLHLAVFEKYKNAQVVIGFAQKVFLCDCVLENGQCADPMKIFRLHLGNSLFRKCVFNKIGNFDEQFKIVDDIDFFYRIKDANIPIAIHDDVVLIYQKHKGNITNNKGLAQLDQLKLIFKTKKRRQDNTCINNPAASNSENTSDVMANWHTAF